MYFKSSADCKGGRLHFKKFETEKIDECIDFIAELVEDARQLTDGTTERVLKATGGGAHLYYEKLSRKLPGIIVQKEDEMECLITGILLQFGHYESWKQKLTTFVLFARLELFHH